MGEVRNLWRISGVWSRWESWDVRGDDRLEEGKGEVDEGEYDEEVEGEEEMLIGNDERMWVV